MESAWLDVLTQFQGCPATDGIDEKALGRRESVEVDVVRAGYQERIVERHGEDWSSKDLHVTCLTRAQYPPSDR